VIDRPEDDCRELVDVEWIQHFGDEDAENWLDSDLDQVQAEQKLTLGLLVGGEAFLVADCLEEDSVEIQTGKLPEFRGREVPKIACFAVFDPAETIDCFVVSVGGGEEVGGARIDGVMDLFDEGLLILILEQGLEG